MLHAYPNGDIQFENNDQENDAREDQFNMKVRDQGLSNNLNNSFDKIGSALSTGAKSISF